MLALGERAAKIPLGLVWLALTEADGYWVVVCSSLVNSQEMTPTYSGAQELHGRWPNQPLFWVYGKQMTKFAPRSRLCHQSDGQTDAMRFGLALCSTIQMHISGSEGFNLGIDHNIFKEL